MCINQRETPVTNFNLTDDQKRILADTTPEQWAEVAINLSKDPEFWKDLGKAVVEGFLDGITQAMKGN
jgi:hypothetical protein